MQHNDLPRREYGMYTDAAAIPLLAAAHTQQYTYMACQL